MALLICRLKSDAVVISLWLSEVFLYVSPYNGSDIDFINPCLPTLEVIVRELKTGIKSDSM